jgi:benzoate-CoA ligase
MSDLLSRLEPPAQFNFAQWIIETNVKRPHKVAVVDDRGAKTYGALSEDIRRFANALRSAGARREERVFLLMHDCSDWHVAFLAAIYMGAVPVAVNTLLTAEDYAFMLSNSRARLAIVSAALLPTLREAMEIATDEGGHEVHKIVVSSATNTQSGDAAAFEDFIQTATQMNPPANTHRDDAAFWLYSSGSTGRPKGTVHTHANPYWTAVL